MIRQLKSVDVSHISYVDRAANQKKFFLTKSEQEPTFEKEVKIIKGEDEEQKLVYGIVYSPGSAEDPSTHDAHGDFMTAEDIEKSAHNFIAKYRNIDAQHDFNAGAGEVVESYVAPVDMDINGETITRGTWVLVTKATDEIWKDIKDGKMTGYSLAGVAETEVIEEVVTKTEEKQAKSFMEHVKAFFVGPKQVEVAKDTHEEETFLTAVEKAGKKISAPNMEDIDSAIESLTNLKTRVTPSQEGAGNEGNNMEFNQEQFEKTLTSAVEKAVGPIKEELASVKKHLNIDEEKTEEDIKVEKAVEAATAPLREEIETLKKSQGISNQQDTDVVQKSDVQKNVWKGLL